MKISERMMLKNKIKRLCLFLLIVFIPVAIVCTLLAVAGVEQWLNILVTVVILTLLYLFYLYLCGLWDKRKEEKLKKDNKKDPFAD